MTRQGVDGMGRITDPRHARADGARHAHQA